MSTMLNMMTDLNPIGEPTSRAPRISNAGPEAWKIAAAVSYRFARQARHDLLNLQNGLNLVRFIQSMPPGEDASAKLDLPMQRLMEISQHTTEHAVAMAYDMAALCQAGNSIAYETAQAQNLGDLLDESLYRRPLGCEQLVEPIRDETSSIHVVEMGAMLRAALAALVFQWSPRTDQDCSDWPPIEVIADERQATLQLPMRDADSAQHVLACRCHAPQRVHCMISPAVVHSTGCMAICLAIHVIQVHGGYVAIEGDEPPQYYRVVLPRRST
jgi:hypothetical protein